MSSSAETSDGEHEVELIVHDPSASGDDGGAAVADEIAPLLTQPEKPKINIFTLSYPRGTSKDRVRKPLEMETSVYRLNLFRGYGVDRDTSVYCVWPSHVPSTLSWKFLLMFFLVIQSIPLLEAAFTRCTIILSPYGVYLIDVFHLLAACGLCPYKLDSVMVVARIILHEKYKIADVGGLACSFFGVLFIFRQMLTTQVKENYSEIAVRQGHVYCLTNEEESVYKNGGKNTSVRGSSYIFAVLAGFALIHNWWNQLLPYKGWIKGI
ncbi:hypothetical protein C1H46_035120 [Malus baccata]|uniref:Uncharacterized protein n=1 Tax=Malus baccata TaxID=106549 RepID=A0A540KYH3_MALBA|nr:hypothetical protein C1H46_035120 [Malus baccata]